MTNLSNYVNYRPAILLDLRAIQAVDTANHPEPKSDRWWIHRLAMDSDMNSVVHVADHKNLRGVLGYAVTTWLTENTIRIDRMMIDGEVRRIKLASRLLLRVLADKPFEVTRLVYTVPEQDIISQLFLKSVGFEAKLPLRQNAFKNTETGVGIRFEWNEVQDEVR